MSFSPRHRWAPGKPRLRPAVAPGRPKVELGPDSPLRTLTRRPPRRLEHPVQAALFEKAELLAARWPELELLHAIPNGGKRHRKVAEDLKREGVKPGVPDCFLPVQRCGFAGLYLETKVDVIVPGADGKPQRYRSHPSRAQKAWIRRLRAEGYAVRVYRSAEEGLRLLELYLAGRLEPLPSERPHVHAR